MGWDDYSKEERKGKVVRFVNVVKFRGAAQD